MFVQSQTPMRTNVLLDALLAALSARPAAALLAAPNVHLYTAVTPALSPTSAVGDFTECTFAGYATAAAPAMIGPVNTANRTRAVHGQVDFTGGAIVAPGETAIGYYVTDTTDAILYMAEEFAQPIPFVNPGDTLSLDVIFPELANTPAQ